MGKRKGETVRLSSLQHANLDFCTPFFVARNSKDEFQAANPQQIPTQITTVAPKLVPVEVPPEEPAMDPEVQEPPVDPCLNLLD